MSAAKRLRAVFSGRVQGVGFRMTAVHLSRSFNVTGYVQNLPDGRVRLVAEGEEARLEGFLGALEREMARHTRKTERNLSPATGAFTGFSVRY